MRELRPVFGVFALVGWVVLIGLHTIWRYSFGWLFTTMAALIDIGIPIPHFHDPHPFGKLADWLRSLDRNVDGALVHAANSLEHSAVWLFSRVGHLLDWVGRRILAVALGVEHAVWKLVTVTIPRLIRRALKLVWSELRALGRYARKLIHSLLRSVSRLWKAVRHALTWAIKHVTALRRWALSKVRGLWHELTAVWKRIKHAERWLFGKGFLALVHSALRRLGAAWMFSYNAKWVGPWFAKFSLADIIEVIKDAVTIASETDICKVASYNYDVAVHVFEPIMEQLIGLEDWVCRHKGETMPSAVTLRPGYDGGWAASATPPITGPFVPARLAPDVPLPRGVVHT